MVASVSRPSSDLEVSLFNLALCCEGSRETIGIIDFGLENAEKISWKPSSKRTQWKTGGAPSSLQLDHSKVRLYVEGQ